jgi:hypothetical protein
LTEIPAQVYADDIGITATELFDNGPRFVKRAVVYQNDFVPDTQRNECLGDRSVQRFKAVRTTINRYDDG